MKVSLSHTLTQRSDIGERVWPSLRLTLFRVQMLTVGQGSKLRGEGVAFTAIDAVSRSNAYSGSRQQTEGRGCGLHCD